MTTGRTPAGTFTTRMLVVLFGIVAGIVVLCLAAVLVLSVERVYDQAEREALGIGRTLAADPAVVDAARESSGATSLDAATLADGPVQQRAEAVRQRTGALFVVVTNDHGLRLSHPDTAELGQEVSTSPDALGGRESVSREAGTLGESVRAKVPVRDGQRVVGEVSVGVPVSAVTGQVRQAAVSIAIIAVLAMALAAGAAALLVRWLRRTTLGLEPEEMAQLVRDQEAVLYGVEDGVIGIGPDGRISIRNKAARMMLDLPRRSEAADVVGRPYTQAGFDDALTQAITGQRSGEGAEASIIRLDTSHRSIRAQVQGVHRDGVDLGQVVLLRDLTAVEDLRSRLSAMRAITDALRAQRHEFANRLHTISGLLANGENEHARTYVAQIMASGPVRDPVANISAVTDPFLRAFIGAKGVQSHERGVDLRVGPETVLEGQLVEAQDVTAILGNLIDNALTAVIEAPEGPAVSAAAGDSGRWVEVDLIGEGSTLHLAVADSGAGVAPGLDIFASGVSTRAEPGLDAHGHGVGLSLSRRLARTTGGDVWLADPGGVQEGQGAVFVARLPGVLSAGTDTEQGEP